SHAVAARVVDRLGLQADSNFMHLDKIKDPEKRQAAMKKADAVPMLQAMIRVAPVKDSHVANIIVEDSEPKRAAVIANEVASAYIAECIALRLSVSEDASKWLEDQLGNLEGKSKESEVAVYNFKKQADMLTVSLEDRQNMVSQRLTALNESLTVVQTKVAGLK